MEEPKIWKTVYCRGSWRIWTAVHGFADRCLTTRPTNHCFRDYACKDTTIFGQTKCFGYFIYKLDVIRKRRAYLNLRGENAEFLGGYPRLSSEGRTNSSELWFLSSEVSFHSSELLFPGSVENNCFPVSYLQIPPKKWLWSGKGREIGRRGALLVVRPKMSTFAEGVS